MNIYQAANHTFSVTEIIDSGESIILVDEEQATASEIMKSLGVSLAEINQFLQPVTKKASEMLFVHECGVITEIRLLCLLGYTEAKKRKSVAA